MESGFRRSVIRSIILFSGVFLALVLCAFFLINTYLPEFLQHKYISRSRELAQVISQSMQNQSLSTPRETMVRRMVELNFPEERNYVQIVIRDRTGVSTLVEGAEDSPPLTELLERKEENPEESAGNEPSRISQITHNNVAYYKISSPIVQGDNKIGEVVVGFSKKYITDRVELNRAQVSQLVYAVSLSFIVLLILFFYFFMRLFLKYKRSEAHVESYRRMAYVGEMSSGLAHEIRNPLNLMAINLQLMRESLREADYEKIEKKISLLESAKDHAARILTEFIGFSRARVRKPEEFALSALLDEVLGCMRDAARERSLSLTGVCEPPLVRVRLDRLELRLVLNNLVLNAIEASQESPERQVRITCSGKRHDVLITVEDTGCGMDEFTLQNLFIPFFSKKHGGTGLGLAVVRRIVEENGWKIDCVSEPNTGTRFTVLLSGVVVS
ncbi:MAG: GHKL domain-containing protein [Spirochaetota bacterium]|jgi:signal transduction histidine kinase|nr:GHKL domain-containing protein [Spirochaetota bacterium]